MKPLNEDLNPICQLLALLGAHNILHVSRIRVKGINVLLAVPCYGAVSVNSYSESVGLKSWPIAGYHGRESLDFHCIFIEISEDHGQLCCMPSPPLNSTQ